MSQTEKEKEMAKGDTVAEKPAAAQTVSISLDTLKERAQTITQLDSRIAAASGNDSTIRKAIVDEILTANKDQVDKLFEQLMGQIKGLDPSVVVGLSSRLEDALKGDLKTMTDTVVDEQVKSKAGEGEDVNALKEQRKVQIEAFRALRTILESLGVTTTEVEEPKRSGGGRPAGSGGTSEKTGKNKEGYRYFWNGKDRPNSQNTFSSLSFYATKGLNDAGEKVEDKKAHMTADALRKYIVSQNVDFPNAENWELELPNGDKIGARKDASLLAGADEPAAPVEGNGAAPATTEGEGVKEPATV